MFEDRSREQPALRLYREALLYPLILVVALAVRILRPAAFAVEGEFAWTFRALHFWQALTAGKLAAGAASDPVGSVALWLSSLGLAVHRMVEGSGPAKWQELASLPVFDPQNLAQMRLLASLWPAVRLPIAVSGAVLAALAAFLAARLWGWRAGLFAGLLLAVSPYHLALSRIAGADALTAGLAVSALLALLWALQGSWALGPLFLSGILAGLAILNHGFLVILVPYGLFLLMASRPARQRPILLSLGSALLWGLTACAAALLAYPLTWVAPAHALQALSASVAGVLPLPGRLPAILAAPATALDVGLRLTPLAMAGLLLSVLRPLLAPHWEGPVLSGLLAFPLLFLLLLPQTNPGEHLPLVAVMALEVVAAIGLDGIATIAESRLRRPALWAGMALSLASLAAIGWQAAVVLNYHPYYPAYRNPWLWAQAPAASQAGWGEGMDLVAAYLNAQPQASQSRVAIRDVPSLSPFFTGETVPLTEESLVTADFVALYNRDWLQAEPLLVPLLEMAPAQTVQLHGIEYARIYANRRIEPVARLLTGQAQADDIVILNRASPFARYYQGPAPYQEIKIETPEQAAADLNALASGRKRLWYVALEGADRQGIVRGLLEGQAMLLQEQQLSGATVSSYLLPPKPDFRPFYPEQTINLDFSGGLSLERAGLAAARVQFRQKIDLVLQWHTRGRPEGNAAVSLRLFDARGECRAQQDGWIVDANDRPTSTWGNVAGNLLTHHALTVPPGLAPGPYRLKIVLYDASTLNPLAPLDPSGPRDSTEVELFPLEVLPAQMPPALADLRLEHPLQVTLAKGVELLACEIGAPLVQAGKEAVVDLWWRVTEPVAAAYQAHLLLLDAQGNVRADQVVDLAGPEYATTAWPPGEVIEGRYRLAVSAEAAAGEAFLGVSLLSPQGPVGKPVQVARLQVSADEHVFRPPEMQQRRLETLGQAVRLLGYDLEPAGVKPGQTLQLKLYWQALAPMQTGYTVFAHLLDAGGQLIAGHDGVPVEGKRPTNAWLLHEVFTDGHAIQVPDAAQPGQYQLEVGLYDANTGARLPVFDSSGTRLPQDSILLGAVTVKAQGESL